MRCLVLLALSFGTLVGSENVVGSSFQAVEEWLERHANAPVDGIVGGTYNREKLAEFSNYIPPGFINVFDFNELEIKLVATRTYRKHSSFDKATKKFEGQAQLQKDGQLINYTAGQPFSRAQIGEAQPDAAGTMVAWNNVHRWQHYGYRVENALAYIRPAERDSSRNLLKGMDGGGDVFRDVTMFYQRVYLSGLAGEADNNYRLDADGSDKYLYKEYMEMYSPFDMAGMKFVLERPVDQKQGDQINSYLPTERRVRRLSAKERADSYIGTNWTFDDFEGWSGMVIDNVWKLLGEKVVPHVLNSEHDSPRFHGPMSTIPKDRWQLRSCYVVEAIPKWEGHPYSRRIIFVDQENFSIPMTLAFNRDGVLWKVFVTTYQKDSDGPEPTVAQSLPRWRGSVAFNLIDGSANVSPAMGPTDFPEVKASTVRKLFSVSNLTGGR